MGVVVVTGSSKGIGLSIVKRLIELGLVVVGLSRTKTPIDSEQFIQVITDVAKINGEDIINAITNCLKIGRDEIVIKSVIHNAAVSKIARIVDSTPEQWTSSFNINLFSAITLFKTCKPYLPKDATFVIVSSIASLNAKAGWGAYCASKAAVNMFVGCLALEEGNVIALSVDPGVVDTEMQASIRETGIGGGMIGEDHAKIVKLFEDGKVIHADVPGKAIAYLAIHATKEMSGQLIVHSDPRIVAMMNSV